MKVFLSHSTKFNFKNELYEPVRKYLDSKHEIVLPEELKVNTKEIIKTCDVFFCEISYLSVGSAIETGWADAFEKPIFCFFKKGFTPSEAFSYLTNKMYEYESEKELVDLMNDILKNL